MHNKNKLITTTAFAAFALWASPAMAQSLDGDFDPDSIELGFFEPNAVDDGSLMGRCKWPLKCPNNPPPDQAELERRERIRENRRAAMAVACQIGAGIAGGAVGLIITTGAKSSGTGMAAGVAVDKVLSATCPSAPSAPSPGK